MNNKICPLLSIAGQAPCPCSTDGCAWWDDLAAACCMVSMADYIRSAGDELERISSAMEGGE